MKTAHHGQAGIYPTASGKPVQVGASSTDCVNDGDRTVVAGRWVEGSNAHAYVRTGRRHQRDCESMIGRRPGPALNAYDRATDLFK